MQGGRRPAILAASLVALCSIPLLYQAGAPLVDLADNNTAAFAQPARNYLRHGLLKSRLGLVLDMGDAAPPFAYNTHHPPLVSIATACVFAITGARDWTARVYPAACTLGSALLVFLLWRRVRGDAPAAVAVIVMALLPVFGHYGKMLGEEAPTLFWALLTVLLYLRWVETPEEGSPLRLAGCLGAYAAGCLSGWAAFHAGPLLMLDALVRLRRRPAARRAALAGIGATGLIVFAVAFAQIAAVSGGLSEIVGAAQGRLLAEGSALSADRTLDAWLLAERGHFLRLYGVEVLAPAGLGLVAALVALLRRRLRADACALLAILAALGAAHPLVFRWAAFYHEWMLFHLLPVIGVAAAEGSILVAAAAGWACGHLRAPARVGTAISIVAAAVPLVYVGASGVRGTAALHANAPGYAWPILGKEIAAQAPAGSTILSNFVFDPIRSSALRFYADRRTAVATSLPAFEERLAGDGPALFVRDLNTPIDPALEGRLSTFPSRQVAMFRIHDLRGSNAVVVAEAEESERLIPLQADFGGKIRLTGYAVAPPSAPPPHPGLVQRYLGLRGAAVSAARVVRVTSSWSVTGAAPPPWKMIGGLTRQTGPDLWISLPSLLLPEQRDRTLAIWGDRRELRVESAFFLEPGSPAGEWEVRLGLFDRGNAVAPDMPGPPVAGRKIVIAGKIPLAF
jgi:4-amino-4-deoxy-L-arabinose transferase-like glycosyltransferase